MTRETSEGGGAPPTTRDSHGGEKGSSHKGKRGKFPFGKMEGPSQLREHKAIDMLFLLLNLR